MNRYPSPNWKVPYRPMGYNVCPEAETRVKSQSGAVYYRMADQIRVGAFMSRRTVRMPVRRLTAKAFGPNPTARRLMRNHRRLAFVLREFPELRQAATA